MSGRRKLFEAGFFEVMSTKMIEINLEENPCPELCIVRSLLTTGRMDFTIGPRPPKHLFLRGEAMDVTTLAETQIRHYGEIKVDPMR